ncbi:chaperonin [Tulasnella sp. 427]|nr:chaperonin [Tulasnella sp. 427]
MSLWSKASLARPIEITCDGTTTATGVKNVAVGCNPMDLRRGSQKAVGHVIPFLEAKKRVITTSEEIAQVAPISANGDTHISNLTATVMEKVGKEGVITVKEGKTIEDSIEITEGMRFDRGFISPYFVNDVKSQRVEIEKSLDVDGETLAACILNKLRGQLQVTCVKAPSFEFGDNRKSVLGDMAILTGGMVFTHELDIKLEKATVDLLGECGSITVTKENPIFLNGVAVIEVGGASEVEVGEKKDRYDDALNATRAAVEDGILPGDGFALLMVSLSLKALEEPAENFDWKLRVSIIRQALKRPVRRIVDNTGAEGSLLEKFAAEDKFGNMVEKGIVDPYKVVKTALVDASGVASLLTTS